MRPAPAGAEGIVDARQDERRRVEHRMPPDHALLRQPVETARRLDQERLYRPFGIQPPHGAARDDNIVARSTGSRRSRRRSRPGPCAGRADRRRRRCGRGGPSAPRRARSGNRHGHCAAPAGPPRGTRRRAAGSGRRRGGGAGLPSRSRPSAGCGGTCAPQARRSPRGRVRARNGLRAAGHAPAGWSRPRCGERKSTRRPP